MHKDPVITFTYEQENEDGERESFVEQRIIGDVGLEEVLQTFLWFLYGMTYSYVEGIDARVKGGGKTSTP